MALETLKGVEKIGGFEVGEINIHKPYPDSFVVVDHDDNEILFRIQDGPIKENGVNGCQVDTLIHAAKIILEGLNENFYSKHNSAAIIRLATALDHLNDRTKDRRKRNVEGTSKA